MRSILTFVTYLPKRVVFAHYVVFVNLMTPRHRVAEIEQRCTAMHRRLFGEAK
jgi:hypothetical protein